MALRRSKIGFAGYKKLTLEIDHFERERIAPKKKRFLVKSRMKWKPKAKKEKLFFLLSI